MPQAVLSRFDTTIFDGSTTPIFGGGGIRSFLSPGGHRGWWVSIGDGADVAVTVGNTGDIVAGDFVLAGYNGAVLRCVSVDSPTQVHLQNGTGKSVTLADKTRLLIATRRPLVYRNALGTDSLGSRVKTDATGRVSVYIPLSRFDYVASSKVAVECSTSAYLTAGDTLSWTHPTGGEHAFVSFVWDTLGEESITSVTYGGTAMNLVTSSGTTYLYSLASPPSGPQTVIVSFTPGGSVNCVAGAITASGMNQTTPIGTAQTASGTSTTSSVSVTVAGVTSVVLHAVGVRDGSNGLVTLSANQALSQWAGTVGSSTPFVSGGAGTRSASGTITSTWAISTSKPWGAIGLERV